MDWLDYPHSGTVLQLIATWFVWIYYIINKYHLIQGQQFMHLTNYSINKHSQTFDKDEGFDKGSKRLH